MASRKKKYIIIGANGLERTTTNYLVDCVPWYSLARVRNLRDYDVVILNLLPFSSNVAQRSAVDWAKFHALIDMRATINILQNGGAILISS